MCKWSTSKVQPLSSKRSCHKSAATELANRSVGHEFPSLSLLKALIMLTLNKSTVHSESLDAAFCLCRFAPQFGCTTRRRLLSTCDREGRNERDLDYIFISSSATIYPS